MLNLYLKIAFRTMWKNKAQSLTGVFGLAFGLACFVPALYWLRYEMSYDGFYPDSDRIYRIYSFDKQASKADALVSGILERKLHEQFPALQNSTTFFIEPTDCKTEEIPYVRLRTLFTDSTFLHVFPQIIVGGDTWQPLQVANNLILTETMAIRLFGKVEKAVGQSIKSISLANDLPYTVTAVVKDPPAHTNLAFDAILSHAQIEMQKSFREESGKEIWTFAFLQMYAKFPPHTDADALAGQLQAYPARSHANPDRELRMLPVSDVRHRLNTDAPFTLNFIRLFVIAGGLLLLSALFNFMNLHFHLFRQRLREFRLRAVNGASGSQLTRQMLFELVCALLLSLAVAGGLVILARPACAEWLGMDREPASWMRLFLVCGIGVTGMIGIAGYLLFRRLSGRALGFRSESKPAGRPSVWPSLAVTLQLAVSIVFILATLVVMMQMRFINRKDLGFDRNGVLYLEGLQPFIKDEVRVALGKELAFIPQIEKITDTDFTPQHGVNPFKMTTNVEWQGKPHTEKPAFHFITTDSRFAETFGVTMLKGEWLDEGGSHAVVLNEEAVRVMGLNEPVGTLIRIALRETAAYRVVGVVKDFHTLSLRSRIRPTLFILSPYPANNLYIRTFPGQEQEVMQRIKKMLPRLDATLADVQPTPLGELYDRLNYSEQAGLKIFSVLAGVCLLIALVGIYAVAAAATHRRRKEIAIRKVAGAEVDSIIRLFFREYLVQVGLVGAVALPLAYLIMHRWLEGYAYRTPIPWWLPAGVWVGVLAVVLLTVLGQVLRAATANPADVVKSE